MFQAMKSLVIGTLLYFVLGSVCRENNVCPTFKDYYTIKNNSKCWYDFSANSDLEGIIVKHGYSVEIHRVVTPDGYILSVYRIPNYEAKAHNSSRGPVLLQHGLFNTAACFVARGKDSLAFLLADAGYDVWLGNYRGTEYSEGHMNLTVYDKQYWDFSIDEIGTYDVPGQLELIAERTGQRGNIVYIGHSLGTTAGMIYGSRYPHHANKTVKLFVFLAPAAELPHTKSPLLKMGATFSNMVLYLLESNDLMRLASQAGPTRKLLRDLCMESPILMQRCLDALNSLLTGPHSQTGAEMVPVILNQFPGGASFKVIRHSTDLVKNKFAHFDYGSGNEKKYGTTTPPAYNVSKIVVPVFIMYSVSDWDTTEKDALSLYDRLAAGARVHKPYKIEEPNFNHFDFLFGRNATALAYKPLLQVLIKTGED